MNYIELFWFQLENEKFHCLQSDEIYMIKKYVRDHKHDWVLHRTEYLTEKDFNSFLVENNIVTKNDY